VVERRRFAREIEKRTDVAEEQWIERGQKGRRDTLDEELDELGVGLARNDDNFGFGVTLDEILGEECSWGTDKSIEFASQLVESVAIKRGALLLGPCSLKPEWEVALVVAACLGDVVDFETQSLEGGGDA
jgi:hypothetical protein